MKRILVIITNPNQASYRVRVEALIRPLAARGLALDVQVRPRGPLARRRLLRTVGEYDAVLLQRKLLDPWDARLLRRHARRIFFDVDDAVMYHPHPVGWLSRWRTTRRFRATAAILDHVVAGNDYLASIFREQGCASVSVLPTVVDVTRYAAKAHAPTDTPRLVWIGSRSTLPLLRELLPSIERARQDVPGLRLLTIADQSLSSSMLPVEHIPWSLAGEAEALRRGDIGIAPTPADAWTLGKCGFKIIQYMATGLPVIASPVGANAQIVRENQTGLLPQRPEDWPGAIVRLARNAQVRAEWGRTARGVVEREYCLERAAEHWAGLLA